MFSKGFFLQCIESCHCVVKGQPITRRQILDWSKMKQSAEDNFKCNENTRKLSERVENTVGKGEIARYEQFLLFQQCFQKACLPGASKRVIVWQKVKGLSYQYSIERRDLWVKFLSDIN